VPMFSQATMCPLSLRFGPHFSLLKISCSRRVEQFEHDLQLALILIVEMRGSTPFDFRFYGERAKAGEVPGSAART
jgi:hypothetical protein